MGLSPIHNRQVYKKNNFKSDYQHIFLCAGNRFFCYTSRTIIFRILINEASILQKWYQIFPKNTGLSLYAWLIFSVLPFYFIFKSSANVDIAIGIGMILLFFLAYRLSFLSEKWSLYIWVSIEMGISILMTLFFGYVYFTIFLAYFIGHIQNKAGFITLYVVHLVTTLVAINIGFFIKTDIFVNQLPFVIICLIGVILLPFNIYNRTKREKLEILLDDANEKISKLLVMEERQRIARDLHDTLGQKLSMIGLKSDLARRLIETDPQNAKVEMTDIHQTARTALKEVREMVSNMRSIKLEDELIRVEQLLKAAQIKVTIKGDPKLIDTSLLVENVLSMCLKEAVTNVVNHSHANICYILIWQSSQDVLIKVQDDGIGIHLNDEQNQTINGHGIKGMRERLEFMNGTLKIISAPNGTTLEMRIPHVIQQSK